MIIFLWLVFSVVVGIYSSKKRISGGFAFGFFLSLFLSPVIGFVATLLSKPDEKLLTEEGDMKKCSQCAELVKREAIKCRYCGSDLEVPKPKETALTKEEENKQSHQAFIFLIALFVVIAGSILWFSLRS